MIWVQQKTGINLAQAQQAALKTAVASKVMVITGGPGVGKTTLVNSVLMVLKAKKLRVALCAHRFEHSMLFAEGAFHRCRGRP